MLNKEAREALLEEFPDLHEECEQCRGKGELKLDPPYGRYTPDELYSDPPLCDECDGAGSTPKRDLPKSVTGCLYAAYAYEVSARSIKDGKDPNYRIAAEQMKTAIRIWQASEKARLRNEDNPE